MINDLATYFVNQSVRDYKQNINRLRRQLVNKYLDFYAGDNTDQYIISHFKSEAFQEIPPISFNITRRFIDRMSRIYTLGAQRNVNTTYDNLVVFKDFKMKHIEKMTRLLGTLAIQIRLVDINTMPHFEYNPIYNFDCYFADDDPFTPIAIVYPVIMPIHDENNMKQRIQYAYWDNMHFVKYDEEGTILEKVEHGLGVLPFAFTHREHQLEQFFSQGAYDLIACNQSINILVTEMALGTPAHVKAAARYNDLLKYFGHKNISPLHDGDKLKWVWLKENKFGIETCALKGDEDAPKEILDFIEENIDYEKIFVSDLKNKLEDFYSALGWGQVPDSTFANAAKFFDF